MIIFSNQIPQNIQAIGGKGKNLCKLVQLKFNVPPFLIIPEANLLELIPTDLIKTKNLDSIKLFIQQVKIPATINKAINEFFKPGDLLAVRSSGGNEDSATHSFAGQYSTELYIDLYEIETAIKKVWLSAFSSHLTAYLEKNNLPIQFALSIVLQKMVNAEISGVGFGLNPINGNPEEQIINALYGIGEGIVSGRYNSDTYTVSKTSLDKNIVVKNKQLKLNQDTKKGLIEAEVNLELQEIPCLLDEQINQIRNILIQLESALNGPQDIEFAIEKNEIFLLQTRPITSIEKKQKIVWDNSNIIESYPEITSELTYSFIQKMYEAVYRQLSLVLGISQKTIDENADVYANMLGHLKGRVYYNLNSWYMSLALLPGYNINARFMEGMMGVKEKMDVTLPPKKNFIVEWFKVFRAFYCVVKNHNRVEKERKIFQAHFETIMNEYNNYQLHNFTIKELLNKYLTFENTLVKKWKAPLLNDFFCMIYFGLLQKLVIKYKLDENGTLHNDLVSGSKDIITTEPAEWSLFIAESIQKNTELKKIFIEKNEHEIWEILHSSDKFSKEMKEIQKYIEKWGERCVGELKLETVTYQQEPTLYISILKNYIKQELNSRNFYRNADKNNRGNAEKLALEKLQGKWIKRKIFVYVLKKARYLVSNRENLRYQRTRGFGMVRKIFCAIGERAFQEQLIQHVKDIFYLPLDTLIEDINNQNFNQWKGLIEKNKQQKTEYLTVNMPERIVSFGEFKDADIIEVGKTQGDDTLLKGLGCCAGIVMAKVTVVHNPNEIGNLQNTILVTSSTDPGWVTLFPSAAGILVERGSLLSHSAIVSREMGIPCIVGVKNILQLLKSGDEVEMNGTTGEIKLINKK